MIKKIIRIIVLSPVFIIYFLAFLLGLDTNLELFWEKCKRVVQMISAKG